MGGSGEGEIRRTDAKMDEKRNGQLHPETDGLIFA